MDHHIARSKDKKHLTNNFFFSSIGSELVSCNPVTVDNASSSSAHKSKRVQHYIELCLNLHDVVKRPRVRCINEEMAKKASRHVSQRLMDLGFQGIRV